MPVKDAAAKSAMLLKSLQDSSLTVEERSDILILCVCEDGLDHRRTVEQLLAEADRGTRRLAEPPAAAPEELEKGGR